MDSALTQWWVSFVFSLTGVSVLYLFFFFMFIPFFWSILGVLRAGSCFL